MEVGFRLDHVVIRVDDLADATADYTALGFTVVQGGEHTTGASRNALIAFADDSYLELIAFKHRAAPSDRPIPKHVRAQELSASSYSPAERRVRPWETAGEGFVDFALFPPSIDAAIMTAQRRGLTLKGPLPGGRRRPDGQQVSWQLGIPDTFDLPFLCADVTPRSLRVPGGAARQHANGATGVASILVLVTALDSSVRRYRALLGLEPQPGSLSAWPEASTVGFVLGAATVALAQPRVAGDELSDHLRRYGEGPYALKLRTGERGRTGTLDPARAHLARIELVVE
jgi:catechol 2,3-dioxygenase-like lactoylglutathione lyase family enzyme